MEEINEASQDHPADFTQDEEDDDDGDEDEEDGEDEDEDEGEEGEEEDEEVTHETRRRNRRRRRQRIGGTASDPDSDEEDGPTLSNFLLSFLQVAQQQYDSDPNQDSGDAPPRLAGLRFLLSLLQQSGRMGDYVLGDRELDNIITELMNQEPSHGGVPPISEEAINNLPRIQLTQQQIDEKIECTVCKDEFQANEKPAQLPCGHFFHLDCISPWLKINGTCPVCRSTFQVQDNQVCLISQNKSSNNENDPTASSNSSSTNIHNNNNSDANGDFSSENNGKSLDSERGSKQEEEDEKPEREFPENEHSLGSNQRISDKTSSNFSYSNGNNKPQKFSSNSSSSSTTSNGSNNSSKSNSSNTSTSKNYVGSNIYEEVD